MKRKHLLISVLSILLLGSIVPTVNASVQPHPGIEKNYKHIHMNEKDLNALLKKGYTKHEIFRAHFISRHSKEKNLEIILKYYKNKKSWEETAKHFGVDMEQIKRKHMEKQKQYYEENKTQIIQYLSKYTGKKPKELEMYLNDGVDLHFLIVASAISKKSNKDLSQIIEYKKTGKGFKEIFHTLQLDPQNVFEEVKKMHNDIRNLE